MIKPIKVGDAVTFLVAGCGGQIREFGLRLGIVQSIDVGTAMVLGEDGLVHPVHIDLVHPKDEVTGGHHA